LEKYIVKNADAIIVNTKDAQEKMQLRYSLDTKINFLSNSFDEEDFNSISEKKYDNFTISHIGSMYNFRKADLLFETMVRLKASNCIDMSKLKIQFVGLNNHIINDVIEEFGLNENVDLCNMVPHIEALKIMMKSHLLLLIKGSGENSAAQIPGKLFEYLGARNKIIYLGPQKTEAANIIIDTKAGYIIENEEGLRKVLINEFNEYQNKINTMETIANQNESLNRYTSQKMAEKFSNIVDRLI